MRTESVCDPAGSGRTVPVWIDTDTGVDDAAALLTALYLERKGKLKIAGVSAVCGNAGVERTFENARDVLFLGGREDIPVYPGASKPLLKELTTAPHVHGENGLGNVTIPHSPAVKETEPAWDALYRCAKNYGGTLELILIGPQTNAAIALHKYPDLAGMLKRILVMGGAEVGGNVTPAAEFNILTDPHAAQTVFKSGVPVVMCGLDVTMKAFFDAGQLEKIDASDKKACRFFSEASRMTRRFYLERGGAAEAYYLHDACPVVYAAAPELFKAYEAGVFVETRGILTEGKTVSDRETDIKFGIKNAFVVLDLERAAFTEIVMNALMEDCVEQRE